MRGLVGGVGSRGETKIIKNLSLAKRRATSGGHQTETISQDSGKGREPQRCRGWLQGTWFHFPGPYSLRLVQNILSH